MPQETRALCSTYLEAGKRQRVTGKFQLETGAEPEAMHLGWYCYSVFLTAGGMIEVSLCFEHSTDCGHCLVIAANTAAAMWRVTRWHTPRMTPVVESVAERLAFCRDQRKGSVLPASLSARLCRDSQVQLFNPRRRVKFRCARLSNDLQKDAPSSS